MYIYIQATRVAASLLKAAGLEELITTSYAAYEDLAVALVEDQERLYSMRRHLEDTRDNSPAFDTARWVMNMEEVRLSLSICIYIYICTYLCIIAYTY
jgi:predicted O-linked N-acetylglucosamine transferase (SPINDLY family)